MNSDQLNFEKRLAAIKAWIKADIFTRFKPAQGVDLVVSLTDVAEAVNRHLPARVDDVIMPGLLEKVRQHVVDNAISRTLPPVRDFIAATRAACKTRGEPAGEAFEGSAYLTGYKHVELLIRAGKPIPDTYLRNTMRKELLEHTSITDQDLYPYEQSLARAMEDAYGT